MTKRAAQILLFISLLFSASTFSDAQANSKIEIKRGVVVEKVACQTDAAHNYALYLPTNYAPETKWAILYAFDPLGNGKAPVEIFREAAERYGFIVVGSNESRNGLSGEKLSEIIDAFWADTHARFSVDERRTYAAGFSGGARVATSYAFSCGGCIAGVVASGAVFMSNLPLDKRLAFPVFGTAGVDDFNYAELADAFETLNKINSPNRLEIFDGRHSWLTKELAFDALAWMNLEAMKTGRMEADKNFIAEAFKKQTSRAQTFLQNGDELNAARIYENIALDFSGFADTKEASEKLAEIGARKTYKKSLREEKELFVKQRKSAAEIVLWSAMPPDVSGGGGGEDAPSVRKEIENFRKQSQAAADSNERRLARRVLSQVLINTLETASYVHERQKNYKAMIANLEVAHLVNPQSPNVLFELARAFALDGRKKKSLEILAQAIENGFADCARIKAKAEWETFLGEKQFQQIIERLKCE